MRIHKGASQSEANQTSRNLLLSEHAKAAPIPVLEIEAYDVLRCSHGATRRPARRGAALLPRVARHPAGRGGAPARRGLLPRGRRPHPERAARARASPRSCSAATRRRVASDGARQRVADALSDVAAGRGARLRGRRPQHRAGQRRRRASTPSTTSARTTAARSARARSGGDQVECPRHGARFDVATGRAVTPARPYARPDLSRAGRGRRRAGRSCARAIRLRQSAASTVGRSFSSVPTPRQRAP